MKKLTTILASLSILTLSGCSGGSGGSDRSLLVTLTEGIKSQFSGGAEKTADFNIEQTFGPEQIAAMSAPTLAGHLLTRDVWSGMTLAFTSRGYDTYHTAEGIGLTFRSDVVVSTRGIGGDLYASDVSGTVRALRSGTSGSYHRSMRFLTPLSGFEDIRLNCQMHRGGVESFVIARQTYTARQYAETCTAGDLTIENRFYSDNAGNVLRSLQWLGPESGYIELFRLKG